MSTMEEITSRSSDLADDYTAKLDAFVSDLLPAFLDNAEYTARSSALMIALNRQLGRCAAAFGDVHGVSVEDMTALVNGQFANNFRICREAVEGKGATVQ